MSLYRESSGVGKKAIGAAILGALVLLAIGFAIGRATAPKPSLESQVAELREEARPVADALELVAIHYGASVEAANAQLDRAVASFDDVEDELALVDPEGTTTARSAIEDLSSLVASGASTAEVEQAAAAAEHAVRAAVGDSS
jgi:multisubunit Na+/H+ antiporter MnhC subunit